MYRLAPLGEAERQRGGRSGDGDGPPSFWDSFGMGLVRVNLQKVELQAPIVVLSLVFGKHSATRTADQATPCSQNPCQRQQTHGPLGSPWTCVLSLNAFLRKTQSLFVFQASKTSICGFCEVIQILGELDEELWHEKPDTVERAHLAEFSCSQQRLDDKYERTGTRIQ